jgi:hypothetical protein
MNPEPFFAQGGIPAGSDAAKGFFFFGVPAGRILTISAMSYWGGDSGENYALVLVPASQEVNDVAIDGAAGMLYLAAPAKGGGNTVSYQGEWIGDLIPSANMDIPGPCSVVIASTNASNAAAFYSGVYGVMRDL